MEKENQGIGTCRTRFLDQFSFFLNVSQPIQVFSSKKMFFLTIYVSKNIVISSSGQSESQFENLMLELPHTNCQLT